MFPFFQVPVVKAYICNYYLQIYFCLITSQGQITSLRKSLVSPVSSTTPGDLNSSEPDWIHVSLHSSASVSFAFLFVSLLHSLTSFLHSFLFLHQLLRLLRARCIYGCVGSDSWLWLCTRPCRTCVYLFQPSLLPRLLCIFVFFGVYAEVFRCSSYLETLTHSLIW